MNINHWFRISIWRPLLLSGGIILMILFSLVWYLQADQVDDRKASSIRIARLLSIAISRQSRPILEGVMRNSSIELDVSRIVLCEDFRITVGVPSDSQDELCRRNFGEGLLASGLRQPIPGVRNTDLVMTWPAYGLVIPVVAFTLLTLLVFLVFAGFGWRIRRFFTTDIIDPLQSGAVALADTDTGGHAKIRINEINEVFERYQEVVLRIKALGEERRLEAGKIAMYETTRNIVHDLKAPLSVFEQVAASGMTDPEEQRPRLHQAIRKFHNMTESIKHSRSGELVKPLECLYDFKSSIEELRPYADKYNVTLSFAGHQSGTGWLDLPKVERALMNLVTNAIEFACSQVRVSLNVRRRALVFEITDDGKGIPPGAEERIFERGETIGKSGGAGLGLAFARYVAYGHGGDVRYMRRSGETIFLLVLENVLPSTESAVSQTSTPKPRAGTVVVTEEAAFIEKIKQSGLSARLRAIILRSDWTAKETEECRYLVTDFFDSEEIAVAGQQRMVLPMTDPVKKLERIRKIVEFEDQSRGNGAQP